MVWCLQTARSAMEQKSTKVMLISANVGSIFEDPEHMLKLWLREFLKTVSNIEPGIFALHLQEVGGKNYEASMQHVNHFIKALLGSELLQRYDRCRVFLDEDFTAVDKFTALGNIYFIHESVEKAEIWNFQEFKFVPVEGKEVLSGNIENVATKEKAKFPQHFFPEFKWSRKGYMRTRWNINNSVFDLVNIHLFHDASNIVAMQSSPSLYCGNRQQALMHTLQRFENDKYEKVPLFIFGDFNFRLDTYNLVESLTNNAMVHKQRGHKDQLSKLVYTDQENTGKVLLTIESKSFDHHDNHSTLFGTNGKWLHQFDKETMAFKDRLHEYDISFQPSYPFSEDLNDGTSYMKTRCPSWCDRVLLSPTAKQLMLQGDKHKPNYDLIGKDTCMGDHKPVCLFFHLRCGQGKHHVSRLPSSNDVVSVNGELVDNFHMDNISIHDYVQFENKHLLLPGFYRCRPTQAGSDPMNCNNNSCAERKTKSFADYAHQVRQFEGVLLRWPKRSRHHSSSSEESADDLSGPGESNTDAVTSPVKQPQQATPPSREPHVVVEQRGQNLQAIKSPYDNVPLLDVRHVPAFPTEVVQLPSVVVKPWPSRCCCCIL